MTTYSELCDIAEEDDILMLSGALSGELPSMAICDDGDCAVIFDYSKITSNSLLLTYTAHELGHCETGAFYTENSLELRCRMEYRANKWALKKLVPADELTDALRSGITELWELADYFCVTEDVIRFAYWVYFDQQI